MIYTLLILSVFAIGFLKGMADTIQTDPKYILNGWKAKWKDASERIEKFPFSSTALVFLTDRWHLVNFIQYRIIHGWLTYIVYVQTGSLKSLFLLLALPILQGIGFKITFRNSINNK